MNSISEIAAAIRAANRTLIVSHARPDGDAIGSQLAVALALEQLGKPVEIVNADPSPPNYRGLPSFEKIQVSERAPTGHDCLIVLECGNLARTGLVDLEAPRVVINIDHHPVNDLYGTLNWVDPGYASVAEMVYLILLDLPVQITPPIAINLYTGILTDTGSFRFSNTTAETFRTAAALVEAGARPGEVAENVLMRQSASRVRLLAEFLSTFQVEADGLISTLLLSQEMLARTGASPNDTEGLVNYGLSLEGVVLCALFKEEDDGSYRVSLRSKGDYDVGSVAEGFGGGGHRNAAGCSLTGTLESVRDQVLSALHGLVESRR
jgi:bifunctional oligoribonuclease and PAP phosphatase NrnA